MTEVTDAMVEAYEKAQWASLTAGNHELESIRAGLAAAMQAAWRPIETAPTCKNVILFAITDTDPPQWNPPNWKMDTGSRPDNPKLPWYWGGYDLKPYDHQPTHWQPLPPPPKEDGKVNKDSQLSPNSLPTNHRTHDKSLKSW